MEVLRDREAIGYLHVAVAAERGQQGGVVAVEVRVVAGPPQATEGAALALHGHAHLLGQSLAHQGRLFDQLQFAGEACLAFGGVFLVAAVVQRQARAARLLGQVYMMLL